MNVLRYLETEPYRIYRSEVGGLCAVVSFLAAVFLTGFYFAELTTFKKMIVAALMFHAINPLLWAATRRVFGRWIDENR